MLLVTISAAALLGAMAGVPLLARGRRLNRRRVQAIEARLILWLAGPLFLMLWAFWVWHASFRLDQLGALTAYVALLAASRARRSGLHRWRAALYGASGVLCLALLLDFWHGHG
jgi:hypothetical protein